MREVIPAAAKDNGDGTRTLDGVTYSSHTCKITVTVTDMLDGRLAASAVYDNSDAANSADAAEHDKAAFTNRYRAEGEAEIRVTKAMNHEKGWDYADSFDFELTAKDNAPMRTKEGGAVVDNAKLTARATKEAKTARFPKLYFTEADIGKEYRYTLKESVPADARNKVKNGITYNDREIAVSIHVTDGGVGDLVFSISYDGERTATLLNQVETVSISGTKTWIDGGKKHDNASEIKLVLTRKSSRTGAETETVSATPVWTGETYTYGDLDKYDAYGYEYVYSVAEERLAGYAAPEQNGYDFINRIDDTVDITAQKVWEDEENHDGIRPGSVTVKILANGVDTGKTLVLDKDNDWRSSVTGLATYDENGKPMAYTLKEVEVEGYIHRRSPAMRRTASRLRIRTRQIRWISPSKRYGAIPQTRTVSGLHPLPFGSSRTERTRAGV